MDRSTERHSRELLTHTLAPIASLLGDPDVQEIMINRPDDAWVERRGRIERFPAEITPVQIRSAIAVLARLEGKEAQEGTPGGILDSRMEGMRVAGVLAPTAVRGHALSIRKHSAVHLSLDDYESCGSFCHRSAAETEASDCSDSARPSAEDVAAGGKGLKDFLRWMVKTRKNVIVAGGTSSGKTTFLNALIAEFDPVDRVLTIEDTPELKVTVPNWVSLESNEQAGVTTRALVRLALRFRPDRLLVGEVRGSEAYDLMQAANTGHKGCLATVHANSALEALSRIETLVLTSDVHWPHSAIQAAIARSFEYVIFMVRRNGIRVMEEVLEVRGLDRGTSEYEVQHIYRRNST